MYTSNIFKLNWRDVIGAVVSAVIVAVLGYVISVGDFWALSFNSIVNIAGLTTCASLLKSFLTDKGGDFLGGIPVK